MARERGTGRSVGLLTGGGDCPGLNAVIRAVVLAASARGIRIVGIEDGFLGLIEGRRRELTPDSVREILAWGGTILGTSNSADPRRWGAPSGPEGKPMQKDVTGECIGRLREWGLDALVVAGGDGSLRVAQHFAHAGVNCIGVPKTIDNDVLGTDLSFGFLTAVATATDALDRVKTTAASHGRVIAVEVMGRHSGWIALHAGLAAGADVILIPEIPFDIGAVCRAIQDRRAQGLRSAVVCVAEGCRPRDGEQVVARIVKEATDPVRLGGIAQRVSEQIEAAMGIESRYVVLGHIQRGGPPVAVDRVLASHFGTRAVELMEAGTETGRNRMVAWSGGTVGDVPLAAAAAGQRLIPSDEPLIGAARALGVSFGD
jgi:phosphofructokinase-like protein